MGHRARIPFLAYELFWCASLVCHALQGCKSRCVLLASIIFFDRFREDSIVRDGAEQGHRRAKLEIVGRAENHMDGLAGDVEHEARAFDQARTEYGMCEIGLSL